MRVFVWIRDSRMYTPFQAAIWPRRCSGYPCSGYRSVVYAGSAMSELPSSSVCSVLGHELLSLSLELLSSLLLGILTLHEFLIVIMNLLGGDPMASQLIFVNDKLSSVVTNPVDLVTNDHDNSESHEKSRDGEADAETD